MNAQATVVCLAHPTEPVLGLCGRCDVYVCQRDGEDVRGTLYCLDCARSVHEEPSAVGRAVPRRAGPRAEWRPFEEARAFARGLGLATAKEWEAFCAGPDLPSDIPRVPNLAKPYAPHWRGWGDWLGTGKKTNGVPFRPFEEARAYVRSLGLRTSADWQAYSKGALPEKGARPADVPGNPNKIYKDDGYAGIWDWLGVPPRRAKARPFAEARAFVHGLKLRGKDDWAAYCRGERRADLGVRPLDIPGSPGRLYPEWAGWGDWLGTHTVAPFLRVYRPFEEARAWVRSLGLRAQRDWIALCRGAEQGRPLLPPDIPATPDRVYKGEWKGMRDWLGGRPPSRRGPYRPFARARAFARGLGLASKAEWFEFAKGELLARGRLPADVPANPCTCYPEDWQGWGDWLGTGAVATFLREFRPFEEARAFARSLGLATEAEWRAYSRAGRLPKDVPSNPDHVYRDAGWRGTGDWLGTGRIAAQDRVFRPFAAARAFVHALGLRSQREWRDYCRGDLAEKKGRRPDDVPSDPRTAYRDQGWRGLRDWLGTSQSEPAVAARGRQTAARRAASRRSSPANRKRKAPGGAS